jgi:glycosyltransferase Alg8
MQDLAGLWWNKQVVAQTAPAQIIEAIDYGIIPTDGKDDSAPLQALIAKLPAQGKVQINLPIGELDFFRPLEINRSETIIKGQGVGRTILQARFGDKMGEAVLLIRPLAHPLSQAALTNSQATKNSRNKVQNVQMRSFTLRHLPPQTTAASTVDSIVLENVVQSSLKNLQLEKGLGYSLVLRKTKDVKVEYVGMDDKSDRN